MQSSVSVDANLLAKKSIMKNEKRVVFKEGTSTSDGKVDNLAKRIERIMGRIDNMERKNQWENQQPPPIRNPNFRKNQNTGKNAIQDH